MKAPELRNSESLPLLDDEFDKTDTVLPDVPAHGEPLLVISELAWDDQLDNGDEMSL